MLNANMKPNTEPNTVEVSTTPDGITTIAINRPSRRNAVDNSTATQLYNAFRAFEDDATQKVCVFHGVGGNFCAGYDLHEASTWQSEPTAAGEGTPPVYAVDPKNQVQGRNMGPMGPSRLIVKKPVISAVAGYAVAGGLELSLLGDMRVVEEDAVFGVFCRRWGAPLIDGGTVRLPAVVGLGRALDMILTGRPVGAQEALTMGLANRVVPKGKAVEEATSIARSLLQFPQECMNIDRANCYRSVYKASSFEDALRSEFEMASPVITKESIQGASRFSKGAGRHGKASL